MRRSMRLHVRRRREFVCGRQAEEVSRLGEEFNVGKDAKPPDKEDAEARQARARELARRALEFDSCHPWAAEAKAGLESRLAPPASR